jgi:transcription elongation factor Elf1
MTNRYEVHTQYNNCPICGSGDIASGTLQMYDKMVWCTVECEDCDATWNEVFSFTHSENLRAAGAAQVEFPVEIE